jgi:hypothetical protein
LLFVAAMIGVPLVSVLVITDAVLDAGKPVLHLALPATIGAAIGLLMIGRSGFANASLQTSAAARRRELGPTATALIVGAALLGTFSGHLPDELVALLNGWVFGFFVAFDLVMARRWRQDPVFRARIRDDLSGSS